MNDVRENLKEKEKVENENNTANNNEDEKKKTTETETPQGDISSSVVSMKRQQSVLQPKKRNIQKLPEPAEYHGTMKKLCNKKCCIQSWEDRFVNLNSREFAYKKVNKTTQTVFLLSSVQKIYNMPAGTTTIMIQTSSKTIKLKAKNVEEAQRFIDAYKKIKAQK